MCKIEHNFGGLACQSCVGTWLTNLCCTCESWLLLALLCRRCRCRRLVPVTHNGLQQTGQPSEVISDPAQKHGWTEHLLDLSLEKQLGHNDFVFREVISDPAQQHGWTEHLLDLSLAKQLGHNDFVFRAVKQPCRYGLGTEVV